MGIVRGKDQAGLTPDEFRETGAHSHGPLFRKDGLGLFKKGYD